MASQLPLPQPDPPVLIERDAGALERLAHYRLSPFGQPRFISFNVIYGRRTQPRCPAQPDP
jgi:hypothetical protein